MYWVTAAQHGIRTSLVLVVVRAAHMRARITRHQPYGFYGFCRLPYDAASSLDGSDHRGFGLVLVPVHWLTLYATCYTLQVSVAVSGAAVLRGAATRTGF